MTENNTHLIDNSQTSIVNYKKAWGAVLIIILLLLLDQTLKIWVKTNMQLHESFQITSWFYIYFTENPGMAFGMEIFGKLFLSLFRLVAIVFIGYYLYKLIKKEYKFGFIACIALILAGAAGNIIDSVFYGVIFDSSYGQVATFMPEGGGYSTWLHGKVVDMFYFPLIETVLPEWLPIWGGNEFVFFRPIFNIADSAICVGVFLLLIFYRQTLSGSLSKEKKEEHTDAA
ncbi:lipoprotein signal peptidase [Parabacteroides sp. PF5-9]|uniref:lipoprotein signal peptidase n=1 Tax=Parabacteroides sp. PF5-9 TaxID=1742404 RepID=UPI002474EC58|nr:lipoprotein signal peptidase [Parabacteroides sp. PF5-9]MDH6357651.1 signal peptidase II [Parabacteroides sp. PF5-9]